MRLAAASLAAVVVLHATAGTAGDASAPVATPTPASAPTAPPAPPAVERPVPKDPDNVRGISPYEEWIARGKALAAQKNLVAAATMFSEALRLKPDDPRAYLLLAQARRDEDVLPIVEQGRANAKKGGEVVESKLMLLRADLLERRASVTPLKEGVDLVEELRSVWEPPRQAWAAHGSYFALNAKALDFAVTADARRKAIGDREAREKTGASVRSKRDNK